MSTDTLALDALLQLQPPWTVQRWTLQRSVRRCDVWIGLKSSRGWLGRRSSTASEDEHVWRHLDVMGIPLWLHVTVPASANLTTIPWAGEDDMPFSHAMAERLFALLDAGVGLDGVCRLLQIPLQDAWKYKYALDHGRAGKAGTRLVAGTDAVPVTAHATADDVGGAIPDPSHPVWTELAQGQRALDIHLLSLKLLMNRVRGQFEVIADDEVRMLKVRELHRFFVRNARLLNHELQQLREAP